MACNLAEYIPCFSEGSEETGFYGFVPHLRNGERLTGTPTVTEVDTSDLTISNIGLNASEVEVDGVTHPANTVVVFKVSGYLASNSPYRLEISAETDASPSREPILYAKFTVAGVPS